MSMWKNNHFPVFNLDLGSMALVRPRRGHNLPCQKQRFYVNSFKRYSPTGRHTDRHIKTDSTKTLSCRVEGR